MRMLVFFTRCSLSRIMYTGLVSSPMNVSRSDVVRKIFPSFSLSTLHIVPRADSSWADESQLPSLLVFASFLPLGLPRPRAGTAIDDFSAALVSTAAIVHWSRKP